MAKYKIRYGVCGICGEGAVPLNHYRSAHGLAISEIFRTTKSKYFCDVHGVSSKDPHWMMKHYWDRHASAGHKTLRPQDNITVESVKRMSWERDRDTVGRFKTDNPAYNTVDKRERLVKLWPLRYTYTKERNRDPDMKTTCGKCGSYFPTTLLNTRHSKRECAEVISRGEQGAELVHPVYERIPNERAGIPASQPITAEAIVKAFEERVKGIDELLAGKDRQIKSLQSELADAYSKHQAEIDRVKAQREQIDARTDGLVARLFKR